MQTIHWSKPTNLTHFCGVDKWPSSGIVNDVEKVTCIYCLRKLLVDKKEDKQFPKVKRCEECSHLNFTEEEQRLYFTIHAKKPEHRCVKFNLQLFHFNNSDHLMRCDKCMRTGYVPINS